MLEEAAVDGELNGHKPEGVDAAFERNGEVVDAHVVQGESGFEITGSVGGESASLSHSDEQKIQEIDSVTFYIENDYNDLAEKVLAELALQLGARPEFAELRRKIGAELDESVDTGVRVAGSVEVVGAEFVASTLGISEMRSEFGIEAGEESAEGDYETHYHRGVAYHEMGLMEEAIREFQDAINLTQPNDGTRRFFHCSNLLGHCFFQNGMANHAITWIRRALEKRDISDEEHHGLWYELALAHEADGDEENAAKYFEKIYAENVDFRDVGSRVKHLVVN